MFIGFSGMTSSLSPAKMGLSSSTGGFCYSSCSAQNRPRQNSVFVPPSKIFMAGSNPIPFTINDSTRRAKSAMDLSNLVLSEEFLDSVRRNSKTSITHL